MAKMPGRCRGKGIGPRIGSPAGRTSAAAVRAGAGGGGSRGAAKSGGLVVFGLGQARPRSEEFGAPVGATLSFDRGARGSLGADGAGAAVELPVDMSPVVIAVAVIADEGAGIACREAPDGLLAAAGGARLDASLAEAPSTRCAAD